MSQPNFNDLITLKLKKNNINDNGFYFFCMNSSTIYTLSTLQLKNNFIGDKSMGSLFFNFKKLRKVNLEKNNLTIKGVNKIFDKKDN